jgi:hypothetical protein
MGRVFRVAKGTLGIPLPPLRAGGELNRKTAGGLPPVPYRSAWRRVPAAWGHARTPYNCREIATEAWVTRKWLDQWSE